MPPPIPPDVGVIDVTVGAATYVNAFVLVLVLRFVIEPPGVVTTTDTAPAAFAGVVTTTLVADLDVIVPAVPPNVTDDASAKPVPVIVTL